MRYVQKNNPDSRGLVPANQPRCVCTATDFAEKSFSRHADARRLVGRFVKHVLGPACGRTRGPGHGERVGTLNPKQL